MSRIGKQIIVCPEEVTVEILTDKIIIKGPKGRLETGFDPALIKVRHHEGKLTVSRQKETKQARSLHGLIRTLIANTIIGVSEGWSKTLRIVGTGYRASLEGGSLVLSLGFSHPVKISPPEGITFELVDKDGLKVIGIDKILVGETAARIRKVKPPEPYKGKGIRYDDEVVRRKAGKAAKTGAAAPA